MSDDIDKSVDDKALVVPVGKSWKVVLLVNKLMRMLFNRETFRVSWINDTSTLGKEGFAETGDKKNDSAIFYIKIPKDPNPPSIVGINGTFTVPFAKRTGDGQSSNGGTGLPAGVTFEEFTICVDGTPDFRWLATWTSDPS